MHSLMFALSIASSLSSLVSGICSDYEFNNNIQGVQLLPSSASLSHNTLSHILTGPNTGYCGFNGTSS